jgi:hypothetical protein
MYPTLVEVSSAAFNTVRLASPFHADVPASSGKCATTKLSTVITLTFDNNTTQWMRLLNAAPTQHHVIVQPEHQYRQLICQSTNSLSRF